MRLLTIRWLFHASKQDTHHVVGKARLPGFSQRYERMLLPRAIRLMPLSNFPQRRRGCPPPFFPLLMSNQDSGRVRHGLLVRSREQVRATERPGAAD